MTDTGCESFPDLDGIPCGKPEVAHVNSACIHEHVNKRRICAACVTRLQDKAGHLGCTACWLSADPHDCLVLVTITWAAGGPPLKVQAVS